MRECSESYILHWNGEDKPWQVNGTNEEQEAGSKHLQDQLTKTLRELGLALEKSSSSDVAWQKRDRTFKAVREMLGLNPKATRDEIAKARKEVSPAREKEI